MDHDRYFWNVPGGGMEYGSSVYENLQREFLEETGLKVQVERYLGTYEHLSPPLHAIELFFEVSQTGGSLILGHDPELTPDKQLITEISFLNLEKLTLIKNSDKHRLFWGINSINDVRIWKGYFNFENKCIK
jgi:8-oxo-dGTP diphosphatase